MKDRKAHWEEIYSDNSPLEVSWYQKEPSLSLNLIRNTGIGKEEFIIDIGGGASILADYLLRDGYSRIAVLDVSSKSLSCTRERLKDEARKIEWYEADITEFNPPHTFSLWHDRAMFHFLTDEFDRKKYVDVLKKTLAPGGHLIIASFAVDGPTKCSGLNIVQYDSKKLLRELGKGFKLIEEISETHITPFEKEQKFSYFRLLRETI